MIVKTGWFGRSNGAEFDREDDGRNLFLRALIKKLYENFSNDDIEIHFNTQFSRSSSKKYLILLEHEYIRPQNYFHNQVNYRLTFGWDERKKGNECFHYVNYPHHPTVKISEDPRIYRYSMVCSNRNILFGKKYESLYYERQKVISYAEKAHKEFFLFGADWHLPFAKKGALSRIGHAMMRQYKQQTSDRKRLSCYMGRVKSKNEVLRRSTFNFCYENIRNYEGYVSEKLWDAVAASCIPVYWPSGFTYKEFIPSELVIDASNFQMPENLFSYLDSISDREIRLWQGELAKYLPSLIPKISFDNYSKVIVDAIKKDLKL